MAFDGLSEKLQATFKKLRGKGKVSEKDIKEAMREVRMALLEADVNFKVAKEFINNVSDKAMGSEVLESLTPAQQIIKIVRDELTEDDAVRICDRFGPCLILKRDDTLKKYLTHEKEICEGILLKL